MPQSNNAYKFGSNNARIYIQSREKYCIPEINFFPSYMKSTFRCEIDKQV